MKTPRIKVNPETGQVVVWEPERTPDAPWFSIYAPDKRPGDAGQFLFTNEDVKDWPDWVPLTHGEFSFFARNIKPGHQVRQGNNLLTVQANQPDGDVHRIDLEGRRQPLILRAYDPVTILAQKWVN